MMRLDPHLSDPDAFYAAIVAANEGLSETQSHMAMLRLVFLLANQIGDQETLAACAREAAAPFRKDDRDG